MKRKIQLIWNIVSAIAVAVLVLVPSVYALLTITVYSPQTTLDKALRSLSAADKESFENVSELTGVANDYGPLPSGGNAMRDGGVDYMQGIGTVIKAEYQARIHYSVQGVERRDETVDLDVDHAVFGIVPVLRVRWMPVEYLQFITPAAKDVEVVINGELSQTIGAGAGASIGVTCERAEQQYGTGNLSCMVGMIPGVYSVSTLDNPGVKVTVHTGFDQSQCKSKGYESDLNNYAPESECGNDLGMVPIYVNDGRISTQQD